jgi:hypothetical protein
MQPAFIICRLGGESGLASFIDRGFENIRH